MDCLVYKMSENCLLQFPKTHGDIFCLTGNRKPNLLTQKRKTSNISSQTDKLKSGNWHFWLKQLLIVFLLIDLSVNQQIILAPVKQSFLNKQWCLNGSYIKRLWDLMKFSFCQHENSPLTLYCLLGLLNHFSFAWIWSNINKCMHKTSQTFGHNFLFTWMTVYVQTFDWYCPCAYYSYIWARLTVCVFGHAREHHVQPVRSRATVLFKHWVTACQNDRQCEMESDDTSTKKRSGWDDP